ncbi:MAG: SRPBCC family protein [Planctomycetes bacterium]|nr:SRPBCC family protein [Planctomycetota bacterium]
MHWIWITLVALALLVLIVYLIGLRVPRAHSATRSIVVQRSPDEIWGVISDFANYPKWRRAMKGIERMADREGKPVWAETSSFGKIPYVVDLSRAPNELVTVIASEKLPFAGRWTYSITPVEGGTRVAITEDGEIKPPIFRALARFVFGYTGTMDVVLKDLAKHFGEDARPA